jgi:hypothetical protein
MKLSKISAGIAGICGLVSAPAFALTAADYSAASAMEIYLSGATAQDNAVASLMTQRFCTAGSLTRYTATGQFVYICTPNTANITTTKTQLVVRKNSIGGSGQGVAPVNGAQVLNFLDLSLINSNTCPTITATTTATTYSCADAAAVFSTGISQIGITDLEPAFFGPAASYSNLLVEPLATVVFGLPVTNNVYKRMQAAQGLTVGDTTTANIPSITTAQLNSLYTQEGQEWSAVLGLTLDTATATADLLKNNTVHVARRVDSSGTQKTYEALIARTPNGDGSAKSCYASGTPFLSGAYAADNNAANTLCDGSGGTTINNDGSGQVQACLNKFNDSGIGAIGVLTTEQVNSTKWKHVRVNGLLPNYENVKSGAWQFYGNGTVNSRVSPAIDAAHAQFLTRLKAQFGLVAAATLHQAFDSTVLITPTPNDKHRAGLMTLKTVDATGGQNPWTRKNPTDGTVDNCAASFAIF